MNNNKVLIYKNLLLDWFNSEDLNTNRLRNILDIEIPMDTGNYEFNILLNSLGWWFDSIECSNKESVKSDTQYRKLIKQISNIKEGI